ncbi:rod shape-determining protein MreC [Corticimicrobacter populi]|uniref:Cell shape-determining protein MreC n=1 Tax=Corticimicrobacter populi TaxID=2175229 RepID=A0A2V1JXI6_9BURK|nr:rod shape-determining protein MreC [Corticimicrobacter populi]PWF21050.1 rod shape-determining protein MreC [Corticimicrobacter populi]
MSAQTAPRLFRHGYSAGVRLLVLVLAALALLFFDSRSKVLEPVRQVISTGLYPFQRLVAFPGDLAAEVNGWMNAAAMIRHENEALQRQRIELAQVSTLAAQLAIENGQLRRLLGVVDTLDESAAVVEVLYEPAHPFQQRLVFNKGSHDGIAPGMPVIDEGGVIGQIIRVTPFTAEAALLTDELVSIPVQTLRNGLRLITFGGNQPGQLEVRYVASNADIETGDVLVTSGVGGWFPAGLPVGKIEDIERDSASGFARATAVPLAHPERYRHFLVLKTDPQQSLSQEGQEVEPADAPAAPAQEEVAP